MPAAKEKPILFSGPMVRAILNGKKTQTRRLIKPQPVWKEAQGMMAAGWSWELSPRGKFKCQLNAWKENEIGNQMVKYSPFGPPGTMLWVRETWIELDKLDWFERNKPRDWLVDFIHPPRRNGVVYRAEISKDSEEFRAELGYRWRSSIYMPRWASRITLRVKRVWVERVQDISEEDAKAEGMDSLGPVGNVPVALDMGVRRYQFANLWEDIYPGSWDANQWVWACEFERVPSAT